MLEMFESMFLQQQEMMDQERREISFEDDFIQEYDLMNFKPPKIPWLPSSFTPPQSQLMRQRRTDNFFQILSVTQVVFWEIIAGSIPNFLAKKYHIINSGELMKNATRYEWNYMALSAVFVMFNEAFGIPLMSTINQTFYQCDKSSKKLKIMDIEESASQLKLGIKTAYGGMTVKKILDTDYCTKASDFLLEPMILIQLPWKPVVLQQWLLGGLAEVLMFERESLELRHWPLPADLKDCASQLLALVRDLKSRIVLGFAIMGRMVHSHPDYDSKFPQYLLEDVVLPSVPVLEFLIAGKAHQIIKNIKKLAWTNSEVETKTFVHESVYTLEIALDEFHAQNYYSAFCWTRTKHFVPFPNPQFDIDAMVLKLKKLAKLEEKCGESKKSLSFEENKLFQLMKLNESDKQQRMNSTSRVDLTQQLIKDFVIHFGKLPNLEVSQVEETFQPTTKMLEFAGEIFDPTKKHDILFAIQEAMMSQEALYLRNLFSTEHGSIIQLINLQLQSLEREQKVKLALTCSQIFDMKLHLKDVKVKTELTVPELLQQISDLKTKIQQQNRQSFLSQFPDEWKSPVKKNESYPKFVKPTDTKPSNGGDIIKTMETRIGTLLYNTFQANSKAHAKGMELFPHSTIIQYFLPSFVAKFKYSDDCHNMEGANSFVCPMHDLHVKQWGFECNPVIYHLNIIELAHGLIKHYENAFLKWLSNMTPKSAYAPMKEEKGESAVLCYHRTYTYIIDKYRQYIKQLVLSYTDMLIPYHGTCIGIDQILFHMAHWPSVAAHMLITDDKFKSMSSKNSVLTLWHQFVWKLVTSVFQVCNEIYSPPIAGKLLPQYPELGELYLASVIVCQLEAVVDIAVAEKQRPENAVTEIRESADSWQTREQHMSVLRSVARVDETPREHLEEVFEKSKSHLYSLYMKMKKFRSKSGSILKCSQYDKLPYSNNPIIKMAMLYFMNGNLDALDRMLTVFKIPYVKKCRHCNKTTGELRACQDCVKQKFPDVNYFCSKTCREARWNAEHMEEHLDFELGLSDYPELQDLSAKAKVG